uniref:Uncharacterized protein n=4 Tax=Meloidogyne TaxID=189290 RepID=A0A915NSH2_9BILA
MLKIFIFSIYCGHVLMLGLKDGLQNTQGYCINQEHVTTFKHGKLGEIYYKFLLNQTAVTESMEEYRLQEEQKVDWGMNLLNNNIFIDDEERLAINIFKGYNSLIRPSPCYNQTIIYVDFGMAMILLINVDEKNQVMQSNAWLTMKWNDCQFSWNPKEYSNIESIRVPVDRVWVPDIVLFNNADGNYEVSYQSNVVVDYQGNVSWVPPAIYKSSCRIDVEYFPFDEQTCMLLFGSWTYSSKEVQLRWYGNKRFVDLEDYSPSGIWDIMDVPGRMSLDKSRVEFRIVIRRKTLFYTIILIIPTVLMAFLSMLVFYLPAECSEKITLAISILLALVVFLLLVSKILPPTSDTIPLMAKYLLMTFVMNIITIMSTVCVLNVHFRSALTHQMPQSVRILFLNFLPKLLCMPLPQPLRRNFGISSIRHRPLNVRGGKRLAEVDTQNTEIGVDKSNTLPFNIIRNLSLNNNTKLKKKQIVRRKRFLTTQSQKERRKLQKGIFNNSSKYLFLNKFSQNLIEKQEELSNLMAKGVSGVQFISEHIRAEMDDKKVRDEWRFISMVIDRLLSLLFFGITLGGAIAIILTVPHIFEQVDQQKVIKQLIAKNRIEILDD